MPRNGSGQYSAPTNSFNPAINGMPATAADWQAVLNDIVSALTQSVSRDGQTAMTGNLPMAGNKVTGLGNATATGDALTFAQLFSQGQQQDIASAATTDIGAPLTTLLNVTGTATITSFGTNYNGPRFLRFAGACTLINSATLVLPGGANITTAAGDSCIAVPLGNPATGWRVVGTGGVSTTGDQTIAGVKTFSSQIVASGGVQGNAATVTNGVYTTGDQTIGGVKTFSSFPVLPATLGGFYKANPSLPAFVKTGGSTLSIRAQTRVEIAGAWVEFLVDTAVTMPALVAGTDYAIWCSPAGALQANADPFNAPATPPVAGARRIGGFHFGLVAPGTTPAGGSFATTGFTNAGGSMIWTQAAVDRIAGINAFSIWDLAWRCKGQQHGMVLDPQTEVWHAIYFCSTNHILHGVSRFNTDVASGTVLPRIPIAYGGDGTLSYGRLSQYEGEEIAASFGLRLPTVDEFRSAMFGVTEAQSLGGAAATVPLTARQPGYTSRLGIEQATGHQWIFARGNSAAGGSGWFVGTAGPNRGDAFGNPWMVLLGGDRNNAANSGSRASLSNFVAWNSIWHIAFRAAGDLLKHA